MMNCTSEKRILLLDTGFSAAPLYHALKQAGLDVWVMGNRPSDLVARMARDRWIEQDYSSRDSVRAAVAQYSIDALVPGCTDKSIEICSQVKGTATNIDYHETIDAMFNKSKFRKICAELDIPHPIVHEPEQLISGKAYICKPVDSFSGKGISTLLGGIDVELDNAIEKARSVSPSGQYLIEEYFNGQLFSISGFIENAKYTEYVVVCEGSSINQFAVDTSYVCENFEPGALSIIIESLERFAQRLNLVDGLLHCQFVLTEYGPKVIEVTRRCPGDLYSLLVEISTGYDYAEKYCSYFIRLSSAARRVAQKYVVRHTISVDIAGPYAGVSFNKQKAVHSFYPLVGIGAVLREKQIDRAGIIFVEEGSREEMHETYDQFIARSIYI